jgi:putative phage-type endonuclease
MLQHTDEWMRARVGKATASRASDWMAELRGGGVPAVRKGYLAELVLERLTNAPAPSYQSQAMLTGIEREPEAKAAYAFWANVDVVECGFIPHPQIANAGASPDGLIGDDGLLETKCPNEATHLDTLLRPDNIPQEYIYQMMFQMAVTGRQWCDFVSYNPHYPQEMRLVVARVLRSAPMIARLEIQAVRFLVEVDVAVEQLRERYVLEAAA